MDREREAAPQRNGQIDGLRIGVLVDGALQWRQIVRISSAPGDGVTTDPRMMYTRITPQSHPWERLRQVDGNGWIIETEAWHPMAPAKPDQRPGNDLTERLAREAGLTEDDPGKWSGGFRVFLANPDDLRRLFALVAEECAKVADAVPPHTWINGSDQFGQPCPVKVVACPKDAAKAIRAKFPRPT